MTQTEPLWGGGGALPKMPTSDERIEIISILASALRHIVEPLLYSYTRVTLYTHHSHTNSPLSYTRSYSKPCTHTLTASHSEFVFIFSSRTETSCCISSSVSGLTLTISTIRDTARPSSPTAAKQQKQYIYIYIVQSYILYNNIHLYYDVRVLQTSCQRIGHQYLSIELYIVTIHYISIVHIT